MKISKVAIQIIIIIISKVALQQRQLIIIIINKAAILIIINKVKAINNLAILILKIMRTIRKIQMNNQIVTRLQMEIMRSRILMDWKIRL